MDDDLPTDFDIIVVGTGMTESIVAAAVSRIGKKVLHIDTTDFYGGMWASFNFEGLQRIIDTSNSTTDDGDNSKMFGLFNVEDHWYVKKEIPTELSTDELHQKEKEAETKSNTLETNETAKFDEEKITEKNEGNIVNEQSNIVEEDKEPIKSVPKKTISNKSSVKEWTQDKVKSEYRKFNVDLAPKLLFACGELVELLISSNIARYTEFRCVNRVLTWLGDALEPVPCSRADVFATKHVSVVEKRMLMKLLTSFMEQDPSKQNDVHGFENKTFLDYLKSKKLTGNLIHYVLYAIAGGTDSTSCSEGIKRCKRFLTSLGRYGNTPFLWSMYGCGELPQCFCRLCAVFGGVYCLKRPLDSIKVIDNPEDPKKSVIIQSDQKELTCEHVVIGIDKVPREHLTKTNFNKGISRAVFVTNKSMLEFEKESLTLLRFPPLEGKSDPVTIIELGPSTSSCPNGLYLVHMTCPQNQNSKLDLQEYAEKLLTFEECDTIKSPEGKSELKTSDHIHTKPKVIWSLYFNMTDTSEDGICNSLSSKIHLCSGPDIDLDFDHAVKQGKEIFSKICKDAEFLPRAPDPEEIIFEGNDTETGPVFEGSDTKVSESEEVCRESGAKPSESINKDEIDLTSVLTLDSSPILSVQDPNKDSE